ncbi:MAG: hypothetical protein V7K40_31805 [Nostoc sp.]
MNQIGEMEVSLWHSFNGGNLPNGLVPMSDWRGLGSHSRDKYH